MTLDNAFEIVGLVTESAVILVLARRRAWRRLPVFFVYCIWALCSDAAAYTIQVVSAHGLGLNVYLVDSALDFALQLCVLVELAWSVLRPLRNWLSLRALWAIGFLFLVAGAAVWPFARLSSIAVSSPAWQVMAQLQQTETIVRVLFFLLLAVCSHLLSLGWRDRELQVATGFGFYSLASHAVAGLNTRQATALQFTHLYRIVAASFLCSLFYWVFSFAHEEVERHEFTPRMRTALMTLAETAHITRAALAGLAPAKPGELDGC